MPGAERLQRGGRVLGLILAWVCAALFALWATGAVWFDLALRNPIVTALFVAALIAVAIWVRGAWRRVGAVLLVCLLTMIGWRFLPARNDRPWQPDVSRTAWAEIKGDEVTLHNVRVCDYRTETDYDAKWETRTVRLSHLTGLDLAINYWGSPYMAHPIASFQFSDAPPVCFSVETRKEVGESYSAVGGLYRQFELIYVVADERDVVRVRSNYRQGEDVYLYRLKLTPADALARFQEYLDALNELHARPRWYNAVTTNCTTSIRSQRQASKRAPWDWRLLVNGFGDELLYERGAVATGGLSFPELKKRALINEAARQANTAPDFSARIREGRPGF